MSFSIDYSNGQTVAAKTLGIAIATAKAYIEHNPLHEATLRGRQQTMPVTATIYDANDKAVAFVTATVVQTLATDLRITSLTDAEREALLRATDPNDRDPDVQSAREKLY